MTKHVIPEAALTQHIAILGKTGAGKTTTAKLAIEQVVAEGSRVCILDPIKSDWWGLTSSADGKRPGLPFHILGGPRGHVPLHANAGKAIGEIVATGALPLSILDMADFAPGGQAHFFVDFAPMLIRKMRGVVYLVIEEAHLFAPKERSGVGKENLSIHWAKTLATAGRSKGIRLVLVTQRTQALHNALLGSCDTMIAHRMTAPADQEPVIKWLKANVQVPETRERIASSLSSLPTGSGWLCSGEARLFDLMKFPRAHTYDNTATPDGNTDAQEVKTAPVDPDKLRAIIGIAVAEAEANDPAKLRQEIAALKKQLSSAPVKTPVSAGAKWTADDLKTAEKRGFETGVAKATREWKEWAKHIRRATHEAVDTALKGAAAEVHVDHVKWSDSFAAPRTPAVERVPLNAGAKRALTGNGHDANVSGVQQRILNALAELEALNSSRPPRELVALLADYTNVKSTGFVKAMSTLSSAGLIEYPSAGEIALTDAGRAVAQAPDQPRTTEELQARIMDMLGGATSRILKPLVEAYPEAMDRQAVAEAAGYGNLKSTGFVKALSQLSTLGFIRYPNPGSVAAKPVLFLEGM